jgi:SHS2 domain-containing protein
MYRVLPHTADAKIEGRAADVDTLFAEMARGLYSMVVVDPARLRSRNRKRVEIPASRLDDLLLDWLSELLFLFETERWLGCDFEIRVDHHGLRGSVGGESYDPKRHRLDHEVKAITYHGLEVTPDDSGWRADVIVDI